MNRRQAKLIFLLIIEAFYFKCKLIAIAFLMEPLEEEEKEELLKKESKNRIKENRIEGNRINRRLVGFEFLLHIFPPCLFCLFFVS